MVTQAQLHEHTARLPFAPFWIRLTSGERIIIGERFRAVAAPTEMVFSTDGKTMRRLAHDQIADAGVVTADERSNGGGAP
jgi:hypothetical protein